MKKSGEAQRDEFLKRITTAGAEKSYYEPIKRNKFKLFKEKNSKKKSYIPEDESQSFADILVKYDNGKLDLRKILKYCVTTRTWAVVNEDDESRQSRKSLFRNQLQGMRSMPKTRTSPDPIKETIVDVMKFVRCTPITGLPKRGTFRMWANRLINRFKYFPGNVLPIIFDNYGYDHQHPGKNKDQDDNERCIKNLNQELLFPSEWEEFFKNEKNKLQLVNLLVDLTKDGAVGKDVYVNRGNDCYFRQNNGKWIPFPILDSSHRQADQVIPLHAVYACIRPEDTICVFADDADVYLSLIHISHEIKSNVFFRQGKVNEKDGITFHDVKSIADTLGPEICQILPCFHALTGSDNTFPFYFRSKIQVFKKMLTTNNSHLLLQLMLTETLVIADVMEFVLRIVFNRPKKEKPLGESRCIMMTSKMKKMDGKITYPSSKNLPPDEALMKMKILQGTYVSIIMSSCLNPTFVPPDPSLYGWKSVDGSWKPV